MRRIPLMLLLFVLLGAIPCTAANDLPAISPQDLLKPDMFPNAQFGMSIESGNDGAIATVKTTGGIFIINKALDTIECVQRIPKERPVSVVRLATGTLKGIRLSHMSSGAVIFTGNNTTVRINGDSLLMIQPNVDGNIRAELSFTPDYHSEFKGNYNFFDPDGGISFFEHGKCPTTRFQAKTDPVRVTWQWKGSNIFWVGISPPKPYDWDYPINNRVVAQGSSVLRFMYPSDLQMALWKSRGLGNIVYMMSETQMNHWQIDLTPRIPSEFRRVINTAHELGMKVMCYASPHHFTKGTPHEVAANLSAEQDGTGGTGWNSGSNSLIYLDQITKLVKEYGIDGFLWDGMYESIEALATNYHLARAGQALVGDNGVLEFHATTDVLGDGHMGVYCPTQQAYFHFVLKGEGEYKNDIPSYLRYVQSTYNISNSTAVACYLQERAPTPEMIDKLLRANTHFHLAEFLLYNGEAEIYRKYYWPRLTPTLKNYILPYDLSRRTGAFDLYRNGYAKE